MYKKHKLISILYDNYAICNICYYIEENYQNLKRH
jgi:hypothetical protein